MERTPESRCVMKTAASTFSPEEMSIKYVCGVDIGSQSCAGCILRSDKSVVAKAIRFANAREGWQVWEEKLGQLDATPSQILIGMEATSRYGEICITSWNNRVCAPSVASWTNPSVSPATGVTCQDRPTRRDDHCQSALEWRGKGWLCAKRASHDVSRSGPLAYPTER